MVALGPEYSILCIMHSYTNKWFKITILVQLQKTAPAFSIWELLNIYLFNSKYWLFMMKLFLLLF